MRILPEAGRRMTPAEHIAEAERLIEKGDDRSRDAARATACYTGALAHIELAKVKAERGEG